MSSAERVRAFLAVPSDPMWIESAKTLVARLHQSLPEASWTRPESWHLTLKFLGEVSQEAISDFTAAIEPVAAETVTGEIQAQGALLFPPRGQARVLGVGFAPSETLEGITRLAEEGERQARKIGAEVSKRPFHPHVTFGRLRHPWPREAVAAYQREVEGWSFPSWQARACVLYASRLERDGAVHTPLAEWSFTGGPRGVRA